jgi:sterol 3beta-glucosyltransferase
VTGYWFLDLAGEYTPPPALLDFLAAGDPPVSIGFGSMVDHEKEEMTRLIVQALDQARQRAVLLGGWAELGFGQLPDNIFPLDFAPHDWLFPRMAAVVHHGGAGTTAAGLRAGVPNVIVPFFADQFFWGWRVAQLGAGPQPIPRKELSAQKLVGAIRQAVGDAGMCARARVLGEQVRAEDGIAQAVELVENYPREKMMVI